MGAAPGDHSALCWGLQRQLKTQFDVLFFRDSIDLADQFFQILSHLRRITPSPLADDLALRIDDELRIGPIPKCVLQPVIHCVHDPRNCRSQLLLRLLGVGEPLVESDRLHVVPNQFGVSERLVDEQELYALGTVVPIRRLQTGDVPEERRSGQAPEGEYRVVAAQVACLELLAVLRVDGHVR